MRAEASTLRAEDSTVELRWCVVRGGLRAFCAKPSPYALADIYLRAFARHHGVILIWVHTGVVLHRQKQLCISNFPGVSSSANRTSGDGRVGRGGLQRIPRTWWAPRLAGRKAGVKRTAVRIPHPHVEFQRSRPLIYKVVLFQGRGCGQHFFVGILILDVLFGGSRGHWRRTIGGFTVSRWRRKGV